MSANGLSGKIALVTGGSRGIGRAIAERLASDGASIVINYINRKNEAAKVVATIEAAGGKALAVRGDVARVAEIDRLFDQAIEHFGKLDILVNNAGILLTSPVAQAIEEDYDRIFDINVKGTFFACRQAANRMSDGGRIVNISSTVTAMMFPSYGLYAASKGAVEQITRVLAKELGQRSITVNSISPGPTDTELFRTGKSEEQISGLAQMAALGRLGEAKDIADVVAFLVSDEARWVSGQNIRVNGGFA
jgi:3-oxoacyl-[acyl-carrier protein] reductase